MRIPYFKRLNEEDKEIYNAMMQLVKKQHLKLDKNLKPPEGFDKA